MLAKPLAHFRQKNLQNWLPGYARHLVQQAREPRLLGGRHLLMAFCDHYEPLWGRADFRQGRARVEAWHQGYPALASRYRDSNGRPPRHTFFFPGEQYAPEYLEPLADLTRRGLGEVEVHLHHDGDTHDAMARDMPRYLDLFARHGHLSRSPSGGYRFSFIHGDWALANARADGKRCGVDDELVLLHQLGCYADFTFPSAPDECQPGIVNQIYWPEGDLRRRRAYEQGVRARVGEVRSDRILIIEGPLALARRPGSLALRIENAAVTAKDPATPSRVETWVKQGIHVEGRPDWIFVKIHTHGAPDAQAASLLGEGGRALHDALAAYNDQRQWRLHYVTAREMFNVAMAALDGKTGNPAEYFDYAVPPPPLST